MLLLIPLKTTAQIDLKTSLSKWVDTSHPHYNSSQLTSEIKRLHALRADVTRSICTDSSYSYTYNNHALKDLMEYHACLLECTNRGFPTCGRDAKVNGTLDANLQFSWRNAFDQHEENTLSDATKSHFNYEIACVLWNIASMMMYRAASVHTWNSKEDLALVKSDYVNSALIFEHIKSILKKANTKPNAITNDLTTPSLDMCQYLCLAQGQVTLYEALKMKLNTDQSVATYTLISQIAAGAADLYDKALISSQESIIKVNPSSKAYGAHFKSLSMLFKARAEYLQSMVDRKKGNYGNEIFRLIRCENMIDEGYDFTKSNGKQSIHMMAGPASLGKNALEVFKTLKRTTKQRLSSVKKENQKIYHEKIPDDCDKIAGKNMMSKNIRDDEGELVALPKEFLPESLSRPMFASIPK